MKINKSNDLTNTKYWNRNWESFVYTNKITFSDLFLKYLPINESYKCLEIGCVPGRFLAFFNKKLK